MALELLMLNKRKKEKTAELESLLRKKEEFSKREKELEQALDEAKTDEELAAVSEGVDELNKELADSNVDEKIESAKAEILEIDSKIDERTKKASDALADKKEKTEKRENVEMNKRTIVGRLNADQRAKFMENEEVRSFVASAREAMKTRGVTGANLTIPTVMLSLIRENVKNYSKLVGKVNLQRVSGSSRQSILGTIPEGVWSEAIANFNEGNITINQIEIDGYMVSCMISVPNVYLEDSDENLAAIIVEHITAGIGKALDKAIVFGTGVRMPLGIATRLAQTSQPSDWGTNAPAWTDLHTTNIQTLNLSAVSGAEFFAALSPAFSAISGKYSNSKNRVWLMNEKTHIAIQAKAIAVDSTGKIVSNTGNEMPFIGGEIIELDFIADNDIIGGYLDVYTLAERAGAAIRTSEHAKFVQNQTVFAGYARYDGKPVFGEAFVAFNIANTTPTTTATFAADEANVELVSLSKLEIGSTPVTLYPPFSPDVLNYHATVTAHSNKITVETVKSGATAVIKNGESSVTNKGNATFTAGENKLTVEVTNGNAAKRTYTVVVTDETTA